MEMDKLRELADNPVWLDGRRSLELCYPVPITPWRAGWWTLRGWKAVAERHVVDFEVAPYTLVEGVPEGELYERDGIWCAKSPESHVGPFLHAVDFLVPDGTPVLAAQDGEIVELVEHNTEWGDGDRFRDSLNFMTVVHPLGERMQYCHLLRRSVEALGLHVGSQVKKGQRIAVVGKNGWTDRDHLHFIVFELDNQPENPFGFRSLVPRFRR